MRCVLATVAFTVVGLASIAIFSYVPPEQRTLQAAAQPVPVTISAQPEEPTHTAGLASPMTRERAITHARYALTVYGEPKPHLVDARRTTYRQALLAVRRDPADYLGLELGVPADREVWLVRFKGTFHRNGIDPGARPGAGFLILEDRTGTELLGGFGAGYNMLTPGPVFKPDPPVR